MKTATLRKLLQPNVNAPSEVVKAARAGLRARRQRDRQNRKRGRE